MWAAARSPIASGYRRIGQIYAVPYGSTLKLLALVWSSYVSKTQTHQIVIFVQERLPEISGLAFAYSSGSLIVHQLESLILAQNERWRHA
jgi:hypothetical protein